MPLRLLIIALVATTLVACSDQSPPTDLAPDDPSFHHGKGGHAGNGGDGGDDGTTEEATEDARAVWVFHDTIADGSAAKIRGDERDANGTAMAGAAEYEGDVCAVHAKIFAQSGDAVLDPDGGKRKDSCGDARYLSFDLAGATERDAPFMNALDVMGLAVGETRLQHFPLTDASVGGCDRLRFDEVRVTRTAAEPGAWTVESLGNHEAACLNWKRGTWQESGINFVLPFRATIEELS